MLPELTLQLLLFRLGATLLIASVQGAAVASAAVLLGDRGPQYDGRLTLNPFAHVDLVGGASILLFGLGWSKPVMVDPAELRFGRAGLLTLVAAPFAGLLLMAVVLRTLMLPALAVLPDATGLPASAFLRIAGEVCVGVALFNLVPIPPLGAGRLWSAIGVTVRARTERIIGFALLAAMATGVIGAAIAPFRGWLWSAIAGA